MMIKDIYYKYLLNLSKIDLHYSLKLFKEKIIKALVQETLKVYLFLYNNNKIKEEILQIYDSSFKNIDYD
jgi:hypothetical protein